jgi:hypothetical protein
VEDTLFPVRLSLEQYFGETRLGHGTALTEQGPVSLQEPWSSSSYSQNVADGQDQAAAG